MRIVLQYRNRNLLKRGSKVILPNVQDEPRPLGAVGSGDFHEKACREFSFKRFTFFLQQVWGLGRAAFPIRK